MGQKQGHGWRGEVGFSYLQLVWVGHLVCRLFADKLGPLAVNVGPRRLLFADNPGQKGPLFVSPTESVCRPPHVAVEVEGRSEAEIVRSLLEKIREFIQELQNREHSLSGARSALRRLDAGSTKWNDLKIQGIDLLEEPTRSRAQNLLARLSEHGVFVVPVGELESWADMGTRRKRRWIVLALQSLSDNGTPAGVADFIQRVIAHARGEQLDGQGTATAV